MWEVHSIGATIPEAPFEVSVAGKSLGSTRLLAFAHRVDGTERVPQILVLYSGGYLRMKAGADPETPLPFGQSLVLGPAVIGSSASFPSTTYFLNPQLQAVEVDTSRLDEHCRGQLVIRVAAADQALAAASTNSTTTNQVMDLAWTIVLDEPTAHEGRISVDGTFAFPAQFTPDPARTAELQSFRLLQISSMFIDAERHDVDALRYAGAGGPVMLTYSPAHVNTLLPAVPAALDAQQRVLDSVHTDDLGLPNGNTPSYRVTLGATSGPMSGPTTPRAYFNASQDLNDDNLGIWLHERPLDVIPAESAGRIAYTVRATTDPLPPLAPPPPGAAAGR